MILCITGTPGTGKTSVAREINGFDVIDLTEFIKRNDIGEMDGEIEVGTGEMAEALEEEIDRTRNILVEGHLSHHLDCDLCIVLRCRPDVLEERLSERDYSEEKVRENVEAEALDIILSEAVSEQDNVLEIDTTGREAVDVAGEIEKKIEKEETGYGETDWSGYL